MLKGVSFRQRRGAVWGDGFVEDEFCNIASSAEWDMISPDELFRFIPNLVNGSSQLWPEPIAWAFRTFLDSADLRNVPAFMDDFPSQATALAIVKQVADNPDRIAFGDKSALSVAFFTGVHPAYIWPVALIAHDRYATFTWLSHVTRRKRALLPLEVAHYLIDALIVSEGEVRCRDPQLVPFLSIVRVSALIEAAQRRASGRSTVFEYSVELGFSLRWWRTQ